MSETSHFQWQMNFDDSWNALQILISKMENYKRCSLHHCMSRKPWGNPMQREVSAQYTQAERKESWRSHFSEGQKALEKPPHALFSSEQGDLTRSSVVRNANPSNLRGSLLEGNKDQQDRTWRNKKFMSSPSMSASVKYHNKRKSTDWRYKTLNTDLLNLDENRFEYKKHCP